MPGGDSSTFGFSGDLEAGFAAAATESTLSLTDGAGMRLTRHGASAGGAEGGFAWSIWFPWDDVRVDSVTWGGTPWHGRLHRIRTGRALASEETGFAVAYEPRGFAAPTDDSESPAGDPATSTTIAAAHRAA